MMEMRDTTRLTTGPERAKTESDALMFRFIKLAVVAVPVVTKFVKSPRGQKLVASAKSRLGGRGTTGTTGAGGR
jgi:hypothetical protein